MHILRLNAINAYLQVIAASPKLSLYKDVLRKRKPLASLATPNSPQQSVLPLAKLSSNSPIANRTRHHNHEGPSTPKIQRSDHPSPEGLSPRLVSSPRGRIQRVWSERSHVRNRVKEIIRQTEGLQVNQSHVTRPTEGQKVNKGHVSGGTPTPETSGHQSKPTKRRASIDIG